MKIFSLLRKPSFDTHIATSLEQAKFDLLHAEDILGEAQLRANYYRTKIDRLKALLPTDNKVATPVASLVPFKEKNIEK